jgi:diketogulonate reductase-like aldo/keto reductase
MTRLGESSEEARALVRTHTFGSLRREVPVIGQGTWQMHDRGARAAQAAAALRLGIQLGLTHIDTAEMYGDGRAEEIVGEAIADVPRERLFIVSKVLPQNASYEGTIRACEASLQRLRTDHLDVYLLHWRGRYPLAETMGAMEALIDGGKIRALGVSNFDVEGLEEARAALRRHPLACDQVLYHLRERRIEHRVLPYCRSQHIALVAYSPFGSGDFPSPHSSRGRVLEEIARSHRANTRQVALAFLTRDEGMFAIPKAELEAHVRENAGAGDLTLSPFDIAAIDAAFPVGRLRGELPTL